MKLFIRITLNFTLFLIMIASVFAGSDENEKEIPLSEVPEIVLTAAQNAVKGIDLKKAEIETTGESIVYDLEGTADGKNYEVEVSSDGKIIAVEEEGDDDEGEEDDDDVDDDSGVEEDLND